MKGSDPWWGWNDRGPAKSPALGQQDCGAGDASVVGAAALGEAQERLGAALVARGDAGGLGAVLSLLELALGGLETVAQLADVERRRVGRLLHQDQHAALGDLH